MACADVYIEPEFNAGGIEATCSIDRTNIAQSENLTIQASVNNPNDNAASVEVAFTINGSTEETKTATVSGGQTDQVIADISYDDLKSQYGEDVNVTPDVNVVSASMASQSSFLRR